MRIVVGERHNAEAYAARCIPGEVGGCGSNEPAREKPELGEQQARRDHLENGGRAVCERSGMERHEQRGRDKRCRKDA